jgi:septum formation protein
MDLILASTSPYRKALLKRLQLPFRCESPRVDEQAAPGEAPAALAARLATAKARAVAARHPGALVIGSDQVAALGAQILGKPGDHPRACEQLRACSGRRVTFFTAVALLSTNFEEQHTERFEVQLRELRAAEIDDYLQRDQPYDCAGSFKWESLGIALFQRLQGDDPTALEGLPLIALCRLLTAAGYPVLSSDAPSKPGNSDR